MAQDSSATRRGYLKATGAGIAALSFAGCVGGGGGGSGGNDSGNGSSGNGSGGGGGGTASGNSGGTTSGGGSGGSTETGSNATASGGANESASGNNSSGNSNGQQTITIGSDIPYKPFEYKTNKGKTVGFDVGIADAVFGDQLGMTPQFQTTSFDSIIPSLNNNNFRVIMSAMTITDDRAKKVDFSDPYFTAYQTIIVLKNSDISKKSDLKGKTVGVQKGTTGADAADKLKKQFGGDLSIKSYDLIPDAFSALINNQVAAIVNDNTVNADFVNSHSDAVRFVKGKGAAAKQGKKAPPYLTLTVEEYGIAFRKNDDDLRKRVNKALSAIRKSGRYDTIYGKYFSG